MKRWGYVAVRPATVLRALFHDKARLDRLRFKAVAATIRNARPPTKDSRHDPKFRRATHSRASLCRPTSTRGAVRFLMDEMLHCATINLDVSQHGTDRRVTRNRRTAPPAMGLSQAGPRSTGALSTIARSSRTARVPPHRFGQAPEPDVLTRRASVTRVGTSR